MGAVGEDPAPGDSAEPNNRTATTPAAKSYRCERLQGRQQEQQQRRGPQGPMPRRGSNCNCCRSQWARTLAQRAWVSMKAAAMMLLLLSTHAAGSSLQGLAQHPAGGAVQSGLAQHPGVDPRSLKQCLNSPYAGRPAGWGDLGQAEPTVQALGVWWSARKPSTANGAAPPLTIATQLSLSRLPQLRAQCRAWRGPLSAVVYVPLLLDQEQQQQQQQQQMGVRQLQQEQEQGHGWVGEHYDDQANDGPFTAAVVDMGGGQVAGFRGSSGHRRQLLSLRELLLDVGAWAGAGAGEQAQGAENNGFETTASGFTNEQRTAGGVGGLSSQQQEQQHHGQGQGQEQQPQQQQQPGQQQPVLPQSVPHLLQLQEAVSRVQELWKEAEADDRGCALDVLLAFETWQDADAMRALYPMNTLRNWARLQARTPLVAALDVDMLPSRALAVEMADPRVSRAMVEQCYGLEPTTTGLDATTATTDDLIYTSATEYLPDDARDLPGDVDATRGTAGVTPGIASSTAASAASVATADTLLHQPAHIPHSRRLRGDLHPRVLHQPQPHTAHSQQAFSTVVGSSYVPEATSSDPNRRLLAGSYEGSTSIANSGSGGSRVGSVFILPAFQTGVEQHQAVTVTRCGRGKASDAAASRRHEQQAATRVADRLAAMSKEQLKLAVVVEAALPFHILNFPAGHAATNFSHWFKTDEPYPIQLAKNFEPWYVAARTTVPWHDSRFRGYGHNKIVQVAAVGAAGLQLLVHPSSFLVHRPHPRSVTRAEAKDNSREFRDLYDKVYRSIKRSIRKQAVAAAEATLSVTGSGAAGPFTHNVLDTTTGTSSQLSSAGTRRPLVQPEHYAQEVSGLPTAISSSSFGGGTADEPQAVGTGLVTVPGGYGAGSEEAAAAQESYTSVGGAAGATGAAAAAVAPQRQQPRRLSAEQKRLARQMAEDYIRANHPHLVQRDVITANKRMYDMARADMARGVYEPSLDPSTRRCLGELPWWRADG